MSSTSGRTKTRHFESPSTAVIWAIAGHQGVDPVELEPPLYEVIDLEAVDALFPGQREGTGAPKGHLTFTYNGFEVHVSSDGDVQISDYSKP